MDPLKLLCEQRLFLDSTLCFYVINGVIKIHKEPQQAFFLVFFFFNGIFVDLLMLLGVFFFLASSGWL